MSEGIELILWDSSPQESLLDETWKTGASLHKLTRRFDHVYGADKWEELLRWAIYMSRDTWIRELHFWGHGMWGRAYVGLQAINWHAMENPDNRLYELFEELSTRFRTNSLLWFRTCCSFGGEDGHHFAKSLLRRFQCRVASQTRVIWMLHSGIHTLSLEKPDPDWSTKEGMKRKKGKVVPTWSMPWHKHTRLVTQDRIPRSW